MASKITNVWEVLGHETKWKARLSCGHEVWLTMKERPGLGQEVPCPTCQPTMAAKWYEPGLERTLDALETADCRAAAREVLTRELERLAAAQPTLPSAIDACTACGGTGKEPLPSQPPATHSESILAVAAQFALDAIIKWEDGERGTVLEAAHTTLEKALTYGERVPAKRAQREKR